MFELLFMAVGAGISAWGASQQSAQQQAQFKYQQKVSENNQRTLGYEADYEADQIRSQYRRLAGTQLAMSAKSGRSIDGSVTDIFNDTKIQQEKDIMSVMYKTKQGIVAEENNKRMYKASAKNAKISGTYGVIGALASGASQMYATYPSIR